MTGFTGGGLLGRCRFKAWKAKTARPPRNLSTPTRARGAGCCGLGEAFLATVASAADASWSIHGASTNSPGTWGCKRSRRRETGEWPPTWVVHGRDRDPDGSEEDADKTAARNRAAAHAAGLNGIITWWVALNKSSLQHNKFLVLSRNGVPVGVWTGSTNLTQGAIYGHSNVGHLIHDPAIAAAFLTYWEQLHAVTTTPQLRNSVEQNNPLPIPLPVPVFSPRRTGSDLLTLTTPTSSMRRIRART